MRIMQSGVILFKESIFHLREDLYEDKNFPFSTSEPGNTKSCISTSFHIKEKWDIGGIFTIYPSEYVEITENYAGFISLIDNPQWITRRPPPHRFGILLASLLAFITKRPVINSVREDYDLLVIDENKKIELALAYPIEKNIEIYQKLFKDGEEQLHKQELENLVMQIISLHENTYKFIVEILRVIQLSINLKSEDFGLAYSLIIQAIEATAQKNFPQEEKDGKRYYINKKFKDFIYEYCPVTEWDNLLPVNEMVSQIPTIHRQHISGWFPSELSAEDLDFSLRVTYALRCNFVHEGHQPPHNHPDISVMPYFEHDKFSYTYEKRKGKEKEKVTKETYLITYDLMLAIAKSSIMKWIKTLK